MNKKKVLVAALVVSLLAILSVGTIAWFSAEDEVKNEFHVADSDHQDADDIFSIDVWEENNSGNRTDAGIEYADILPGDERVKKARVENTGYYDQYVRVIITISDATAWLNAVGEDYDMSTVFVNFDETKWAPIEKKIEGEPDTITYVLYYKDVLKEGEVIKLFNAVKIPSELTQQNAAAFKGGFTVNVKAQAVQTENVGNSAYEAFQTVKMEY